MSDTSHKRKNTRSKRTEIKGEDGWTRITSDPVTGRKSTRPVRNRPGVPQVIQFLAKDDISEAPSDMTLGKAKENYEKIEAKWINSESWKALRELLEKVITQNTQIDLAILFGTGSPTGVLGGWIQRNDTSLYQIAVFKNMLQVIAQINGRKIPAYAQEPRYNSLDIDLLASLGVTVIETPEGFEKLTRNSLAYAPGAELFVDMSILAISPAFFLSGKLDYYWRNEKGQPCTDRRAQEIEGKFVNTCDLAYSDDPEERAQADSVDQESLEKDCRILEEFRRDKAESGLPSLDVKDYPFHNAHLYWRKEEGGEDDTAK